MKSLLSTLLLLLLTILTTCKKELDIPDNFTADVEYRLENIDANWKKRGAINFFEKSNTKNNKSNASVVNEPLSTKEIERIKKECEASGLYLIRVKTGNKYFYSGVDSCLLLKNQFKDKFVINYFSSIKNDQIVSINYDIDINGQLNDNVKKNFVSLVDTVNTYSSMGPIFPEDKEEDKKQTPAEPGFLQKYWWVILIILIISSLKAPAEEGQAAAS